MMAFDWDPFTGGTDSELIARDAASHGGKGGFVLLIIQFWPYVLMGFSGYFALGEFSFLKRELR